MTRLIKKYKNRRLYDTESSQYITIDTLQRYVLDNIPFRVEDSSTKVDITASTLLQILVEIEGSGNPFLSVEILKQLIIVANHPLNRNFRTMLEQFFTTWSGY